MHYRFDQCSLIGENVVRRAFAHIVPASASDKALSHFVLHNPLPFARQEVVDIALPFRAGWPHAYIDGLTTGEVINRFQILDHQGNAVPYQLLRIDRNVESKRLGDDARGHIKAGEDWYHVAAEVILPPAGYTGFRVEPCPEANRNMHTMLKEPMTASNGVLEVSIHSDGTVSVRDLARGNTYSDWSWYEDCGDSGDGWTRGELVDDIIFRSPGNRCSTAVVERGALRTTFRIERVFELPSEMIRHAWRRSENRRELVVVDEISLTKDSPIIRVRTTVDNTIKDHRFRVLFPSDVNTDVSFAETPFAIVERPIPIPPEQSRWHERPNPEYPFTTFCGVENGTKGLAVLSPAGPREYEVFDDARRTLALTLYRSMFKTVATSGEPEGQLLQRMVFEYALFPFAGAFDPIKAARFVSELQVGVKMHHAEQLIEPRSFMEQCEHTAIVTAIKPAADGNGGIIRLWNPNNLRTAETLRFAVPLTSAAICNLNEEMIEPIELDDVHEVTVPVSGHGLTTVRITWASEEKVSQEE